MSRQTQKRKATRAVPQVVDVKRADEPRKRIAEAAVLLVQADPDKRRRVADQLTQTGFIVVTAPSAADAIELCEHFAVAAIVWDVPPPPDVDVAMTAMRRIQPKLACCVIEDTEKPGEPHRAPVDGNAQAQRLKLRLLHTIE
jgi:PleD family two-component response regulator